MRIERDGIYGGQRVYQIVRRVDAVEDGEADEKIMIQHGPTEAFDNAPVIEMHKLVWTEYDEFVSVYASKSDGDSCHE